MIFRDRPRNFKSAGNLVRLFMVVSVVAPLTLACQAGNSEKPKVQAQPAKSVSINSAVLDYVDRSIQEGRLDESKSILEQILVTNSKHARTRLLLAELQLASGSKKLAAQLFSELTGTPELAARAYQGMGIAYLQQGERERAVKALSKSVAIDTNNWRAWNGLGFHYDSLGKWEQAQHSYTKALSANPDSAVIYSNRGYSLVLSGNVDAAILDLTKAVELDPGLEIAQINLRLALAWKGRYREALMGIEDRKLAKAFNNVGFVALMRGDRDSAERYLREAMKLDATFNETAWRNLDYLKGLKELDKIPKKSIKIQ